MFGTTDFPDISKQTWLPMFSLLYFCHHEEGVVERYLGLYFLRRVYGLWSWHTSPTFFNANRINGLDHANNQLEVVIAKFYCVCSFSNSVVCQNQ